ncbi:conserved hypothetical protein [Candidatus Accumulibacter aalborgensis]|uniref:Uncharacterized protein n=1 Tax=Candidatus Accumulibacter aalborgensis TaxID=1860102 RepID=A0A1A8XS47_9PROT|nr:conserved hypothetical protein [Candidatus Accumulibacter aalborgensis]
MAVIPICVKTPKGIEEVEKRTCRLAPRARQVLIVIDGKRDYDALLTMFSADTLPAVCRQLLDEGFIVPLRGNEPVPTLPPTPVRSVTVSADAAPLSAIDEQRLKMARNFMTNTLRTFVGNSASSLINHIDVAARLEDLHELAMPWRAAISLSSDGRKQLADLESKLSVIDECFLLAWNVPAAAPVGASAAAKPAAGVPTATPAPADDDERLGMARNFMLNTLDAFVGMAASSLIARVEGSPSIEELRHLFSEWHDAIALSGDGRKRLDELEAKLAALLS